MSRLDSSKLLNDTLKMDKLEVMPYGYIFDLRQSVEKVKTVLTNMKNSHWEKGELQMASYYETKLIYARKNLDIIDVVMLSKEGDFCEHTSIETVWLN
jgi:hypothetical protein